jgi:hypothetical protein
MMEVDDGLRELWSRRSEGGRENKSEGGAKGKERFRGHDWQKSRCQAGNARQHFHFVLRVTTALVLPAGLSLSLCWLGLEAVKGQSLVDETWQAVERQTRSVLVLGAENVLQEEGNVNVPEKR